MFWRHRTGRFFNKLIERRQFDAENSEHDADAYGIWFNLLAGFDPYAGAGTLAKLSMASGTAGLVSEILSEHYSVHGSTSTRLQKMYQLLQSLCNRPEGRTACANYKYLIHPHFPPSAPLGIPNPTTPAFEMAPVLPVLKRQSEQKRPEAP